MSTAAQAATLGDRIQKVEAARNIKFDVFDGMVNTGASVISTCETLFLNTFDSATLFKAVLTTTNKRKGTNCISLQSLDDLEVGNHKAYAVIDSENWSGSNRIGFWIYADTTLDAGALQLHIKDSVAGNQTVNLPEISVGVPTWVELDISALTLTDVEEFGFKRNDSLVFRAYVDQIVRFNTTNTVTLSSDPAFESAQILGIPLEEASHHQFTKLVEDTDYILGVDTGRVIFLTDQSAKHFICFYGEN